MGAQERAQREESKGDFFSFGAYLTPNKALLVVGCQRRQMSSHTNCGDDSRLRGDTQYRGVGGESS